VKWIRTSFCAGLVESFRNVTVIERLMKGSTRSERLIADVLHLNAWASWPLLLKLMAFHSHELPRLEEVLRLMEITLFKLEFMKGKSTNSLPEIGFRYQGNDLATLTRELEHVSQHGFKGYWDFNGEIRRFLEGSYHYDRRTRYLLWKFENSLRAEERGEHPLLLQVYLNESEGQNLDGSLEHIMPKDPEGLVHTQEFQRDYLHNIGNLVLMTRGRNSSLKNKPPLEKATGLKLTSYLTQQAVVRTIHAEGGWGEAQIAARKKLIVDFAMKFWRIGIVAQ
ncbi:MAG: HNH endonuclease, partial [Cytophagaceae bacterium]